VTRRLTPILVLALVLAVAAAMTGTYLTRRVQRSDPEERQPSADPAPGLTLLVVRAGAGPLLVVVGSEQGGAPGAVVVPVNVITTIPGQGDGTIAEAALLPGRQAATTVANLLGVWIPHYAVTDTAHVAAVVDRVGGIDVLGQHRTGGEVTAILDEAGPGRLLQWREAVDGLLSAGASWEAADLLESDGGSTPGLLSAASGADAAQVLPTKQATQGLKQPDRDAIVQLMALAFGAPGEPPVPVIVLNGSGVPGIGEAVAEQLIPGGFRVVVNGNASSFDHRETLVVAGTEEELGSAERVAELLGVGSVSVSGIPSGLGDVTIVVGKDFQTG
jgi:hypothetical protein